MLNRNPPEELLLEEEPAEMVVVVPGVRTAASTSNEVCNGAGRGRGVRLLRRDEYRSWLALRFAVPGRMTSLISASSRSMLSSEFSRVMTDISNSFSTWIPPAPSWYSFTLVNPPVAPVTAVEPVMAVVPVMEVFLLAWRDEMTVMGPDRALCMGSPLPPPYRLVKCELARSFILTKRGRRVASEDAVMAMPHSTILHIAKSVKL